MGGDTRRPATPQDAFMRNIWGRFEGFLGCCRRPGHKGFKGFIPFAAPLASARRDSGPIIILGASPARRAVAPLSARTLSQRLPKLA